MPRWRVYLFKFCAFVGALTPLSWLNALGDFLGWLWYDVFRIRRQVIDDNLKLAFPNWSEAQRDKVGRHSVQVLTRSFTQILALAKIDEEWIRKNVVIEGEEHCRQALSKGKGAYFMSMHIGSADVGMNILALLKLPIVVISKKFKNQLLNDFWFYLRGRTGARFIDPHSPNNAFEIFKEIKNKNIVIFVLDQFMGKPYGIETSFFGVKTGTAYGLALFAMKTKSPVVPVYNYWGEDSKVHLVFEPELKYDEMITDDKDTSLKNITQRFNDEIERVVRRHPQHWMWVHKRWKVFE